MSKLRIVALGLGVWGIVAVVSFLTYVFAGYAWWDHVGYEFGSARNDAAFAFIFGGWVAGAFAIGLWLSDD